jgi:hypothetical protein
MGVLHDVDMVRITTDLYRKKMSRTWHKIRWKERIRKLRTGWEDNIKIPLKEIDLDVVDWIYLAEGSVQLQVVLNIVLDILIHKRQGSSRNTVGSALYISVQQLT